MIDIPLDAKVDCADGQCGESVTVIVNPTTREVTHFVVKHKSFPGACQVMVPVEQMVETTLEYSSAGASTLSSRPILPNSVHVAIVVHRYV